MQHSVVVSIGMIKAVFESEHVPDLLQGEATHDAATRFVAQLVRFTADEDRILALVAAALPPNYAGDTLMEIPAMVAGALRKGYDARPARPASGKRKPCDVLAELIEASGAEFFTTRCVMPISACQPRAATASSMSALVPMHADYS
ncbi:hypothetical protein LG047_12260 [Methylocystis sp. WRRC1]|uniref:hypothetical protein n=1 Tax=Methylocystis sp. WRRC1 TaxID=1732014 RepID=UPI001D13461F|nr:hypothetical protein [Methylocystis sp. WRRC1]MCC3246086.1 hypothetical protein [Methylocystis sp. WRRC1]